MIGLIARGLIARGLIAQGRMTRAGRAPSHRAARLRVSLAGAVGAIGAAVALAACTSTGTGTSTSVVVGSLPSFSAFSLPPVLVGRAAVLQQLGALRIRTGPAPPGYSPDAFGTGWAKVTGTNCTTENLVLKRDLKNRSLANSTSCVVTSGALYDPYTGQWIWYERAGTPTPAVAVERMISLPDAWASGAYGWTPKIRRAFANDPAELFAAGTATIAARSGANAASWLPPNTADRCAYVAQQVRVKAAYYLTITQAEHDAMVAVLSGCPQDLGVPQPTSSPPPPPASGSAAATLQAGGAAPRTRAATKTPDVRSITPLIVPRNTAGPTTPIPTEAPIPPSTTPPPSSTPLPPPPPPLSSTPLPPPPPPPASSTPPPPPASSTPPPPPASSAPPPPPPASSTPPPPPASSTPPPPTDTSTPTVTPTNTATPTVSSTDTGTPTVTPTVSPSVPVAQ